MIQIILIIIPVILVFIFLLLVFWLGLVLFSSFYSDFVGAPYIQNDDKVIMESLKLAKVSSKTKLIDLGSGNGKVLRMAQKYFNVKNVLGYELAPWPYLLSKFNKTKTIRKSLFDVDLSKCNVIYVYLLPKILKKLTKKLADFKKENPNAKIVSPVFEIKELKPLKVIKCYHKGFKKDVSIFLY
ncbi:hypothetical protein CO058_01600 [candidate division WWE3 bacterium CG_4_9_14_0_2_um_filter_35_11]|uniref:DOT1 domain-containing protein n=1 Tax=candidate division WWE3 bacterium CG_4_9_14_0_2_um_filter_35_11 TaxID=1975077 RepID=A0A2M8EM80_UNCKA|nr:MAG: hypothetical protein COV25_04120 [candidate division WWE3 bacterium CG10_big_fil_rev_8_21_14_0_10_35_32]PJC23787.1 MAG: hypothetical protein CO058_01600 [candidate division WWE3 bacterium CG_4_9_14_0_2_um_filter_35_11]